MKRIYYVFTVIAAASIAIPVATSLNVLRVTT